MHVIKQWRRINGRQLLIESVGWPEAEKHMQSLPKASEVERKPIRQARVGRDLPTKQVAVKTSEPIRVAGLPYREEGFVIDYITVVTQPSWTFQSGQTYLVPNDVTVPSADFQAGAIIGHQTYFNVAYIQFYNPSSISGINLKLMVGNVVGAAVSRYPNIPYPAVIRGTQEEPFQLQAAANWLQLAYQDLTNLFGARNLYYFGHGSPDRIGWSDDVNQQINLTDLKNILKNSPDALKGTNGHPYRFVFIDGCKTAQGALPPAFGIPKGKVVLEEFLKRGLRPRAFLGWDKSVTLDWADAFNQQHAEFIGRLFDKWANHRDQSGNPIGIKEAIDLASKNSSGQVIFIHASKLIIHGYEDLRFQDDL